MMLFEGLRQGVPLMRRVGRCGPELRLSREAFPGRKARVLHGGQFGAGEKRVLPPTLRGVGRRFAVNNRELVEGGWG